MYTEINLKPDSKGRITLGKLAEGIDSYHVEVKEDGRLILEPMVSIPAREHWLYKNKKAMASLKKGIKQAEEGKLHDLGSFSKFADENDI